MSNIASCNDQLHSPNSTSLEKNTPSIYFVNPVGSYPIFVVEAFMSTESELRIRREDILLRHNIPGADESIYDQDRWVEYEVRSQIAAAINPDNIRLTHITIPANYVGGLAVFSRLF